MAFNQSNKPVENWKTRRRHGMVMTRIEMGVLQYLREAKAHDPECPIADLPGVDPRVIRSLMTKGWIFVSPGLDGTKYYISVHGERALRIFEKPTPRFDGICPRCNERPVHISKNGRNTRYCLECQRKQNKRKYELKLPRFQSKICPRCGERPRHQLKSGRYQTYCAECIHEGRKEERRRRRERELERIQNGEVLLCRRCKNAPRRLAGKYLSDYCDDCYRAYMAEYNDKRRPNSRAAKERKP